MLENIVINENSWRPILQKQKPKIEWHHRGFNENNL